MPDTASSPAAVSGAAIDPGRDRCEGSRWAVFAECPHCAGEMAPEHAHYRCAGCGWRDSCCD